MRVRQATPGDAAGVAAVLNAVIAEGRHSMLDTPFSVEDERAFIAGLPARAFVHVADVAGVIVGAQTVEPWNAYATHEFDHVATMGTWVAEAWRRRGVGSRLAVASFTAARELGYEKVFTDVLAHNAPSLAFHLSLGFTVVGAARRHARLAGDDADVVFIERFLEG